jgi:hypothetical protein
MPVVLVRTPGLAKPREVQVPEQLTVGCILLLAPVKGTRSFQRKSFQNVFNQTVNETQTLNVIQVYLTKHNLLSHVPPQSALSNRLIAKKHEKL